MALDTHPDRPERAWLVKWLLVLGAFGIYALAFPWLFRLLAGGALPLIGLPVIVAGWLFGLRPALLASLLAAPLAVLLCAAAGQPGLSAITAKGYPAGWFMMLAVGALVGRLSDIRGQLKAELAQRRRAEDALQARETLLRAVTENSPLAYLVVDNRTDGILYFNHRYAEMWGIEHLEDRMRQGTLKCGDVIPDCDANVLDVPAFVATCEPLRDANDRRVVNDEVRFTDGRVIRRFSAQIREADDVYFGRLHVFEDITRRRRAEEALRESADQFRTIFHSAGEAITIAGVAGQLLEVNGAACRRLGYTRGELLRLSVRDIAAAELQADVARRLDEPSGSSPHRFEGVQVRKDGTRIPVEISLSWITYEGKPATLAVVHDLTERKEAERVLTASRDELERRVAQRTAELGATNAQLQREMAAGRLKEEALRESEERRYRAVVMERERISRELHDGTAQILGYANIKAQAAEALLAAGKPDAARDQMAQLSQAARDAYVDVREAILGLRLGGEGHQPLANILHDCVGQVGQLDPSCAIAVDVAPEAATLVLPPDVEVQVVRIVQEALANVRKHAAASHAWVRLQVEGRALVIRIEDDGRGFDTRHPARDREPHFGLKTMQERAESIDGRMTIESAHGQGTRLTLTVCDDDEAAVGADAGGEARPVDESASLVLNPG
jgi:PAS domain S-box-containing protein